MASHKAPLSAADLSKRNVQDLARVMATEAAGSRVRLPRSPSAGV